MHALQTFMSSLSIGSPTSWEGLTVYPLLRPTAPEPFYDTLSEAIRGGTLHISEVSESGSVPELRVVNDGAPGCPGEVRMLAGRTGELIWAQTKAAARAGRVAAPRKAPCIRPRPRC